MARNFHLFQSLSQSHKLYMRVQTVLQHQHQHITGSMDLLILILISGIFAILICISLPSNIWNIVLYTSFCLCLAVFRVTGSVCEAHHNSELCVLFSYHSNIVVINQSLMFYFMCLWLFCIYSLLRSSRLEVPIFILVMKFVLLLLRFKCFVLCFGNQFLNYYAFC